MDQNSVEDKIFEIISALCSEDISKNEAVDQLTELSNAYQLYAIKDMDRCVTEALERYWKKG